MKLVEEIDYQFDVEKLKKEYPDIKSDSFGSRMEGLSVQHRKNIPSPWKKIDGLESLKHYDQGCTEKDFSIVHKNFKILIHCFTGSKKFAFELLDLGAYISASGVVTFKKSNELAETFKIIPENRILVETDAPYLAPIPLRGKSNEPSYIIHTVEFLSKLKNIPFNEFAERTTKNFYNLFGELN